ncbi:unnamed protein product [Dibothriocephalus latus]|uniref:Reverse transcriptase domain-containing protein n=1 Tax=Dibothriocephalus latus TaxID=60516 RepID=A0A3P7LJR8_DIBLA|nr:unnamed protein product [Dibothriocephalus latus]
MFTHLKFHESDRPLKSRHQLGLLPHCLKDDFTFSGQRYEQIKRTPLGSSPSGLVAEVLCQRIEHLVFSKFQPMFWAWHFDETFVIIKTSGIKHLKELLKLVVANIHFIMEAE